MATHPIPHENPDGEPHEADTGAPNPTQLPVEPEFAPVLPPAEPEDPGVPRPTI